MSWEPRRTEREAQPRTQTGGFSVGLWGFLGINQHEIEPERSSLTRHGQLIPGAVREHRRRGAG